MSTEIKVERIVGMAIITSVFRMEYRNDVIFSEIHEDDAWDEIIKMVDWYMDDLGLEYKPVDMYAIAEALWGMDTDQVDEEIEDLS